eukprot:TRINITY_DN3346_c2_g2_i9.p1 TRINITY_DN3346_c2_g2~~TRINITY_DN3346_c2_g2_i9.p1  ORF type:complete len:474 (+),score=152.91 TRINITY_DN3346_c2_g2_i9:35-1456(+)
MFADTNMYSRQSGSGGNSRQYIQYTWSMVFACFMVGFVSMLVVEEFTKPKRERTECPSTLEMMSMLKRLDQMRYYDKFMLAGLDRPDIIGKASFLDVADSVEGIKPYHWARIKAEALRMTTRKQVSVSKLLEFEPLSRIKTDPPSTGEDSSDLFVHIPAEQYLPDGRKGASMVTTVCTGSLHDRVGNLFNALTLAKSLNGDLHVIWPEEDACPSRFPTLFQVGDHVSVSVITKDKKLSDAVPSIQPFDAVLTSNTGYFSDLIGNLPTQLAKPSDQASSVWYCKDVKSLAVDPTSDLVAWLKDRSSSDLRSHVLYVSDGVANGVTTSGVKDAVKAYGIRLTTEVADISKNIITNNELRSDNTVAVYEADLPDVSLASLPETGDRKKLLILSSPKALTPKERPPIPDSITAITSIYNINGDASERSIKQLLATCQALGSLRIKILPENPATPSTQSNRPEAVLAPVLCDAGITCS